MWSQKSSFYSLCFIFYHVGVGEDSPPEPAGEEAGRTLALALNRLTLYGERIRRIHPGGILQIRDGLDAPL